MKSERAKVMTPRRKKKYTPPEDMEQDNEIPGTEFAAPQPRRPRAVMHPGSPSKHFGHGSPQCFQMSDAEAAEELRELLGYVGDKDVPAGGRPLSSVSTAASCSTSAGPTPSPDSRPASSMSMSRPISSADHTVPAWPRIDENSADLGEHVEDEEEHSMKAPADHGAYSKSPKFKVFIGGVPQDMDQEEVKQVLNRYTTHVKKAWLQRHKDQSNQGTPTAKHRGFGFAILQDAEAVEKLLDGKNSRYIPLDGGRRIEVKPAVSNGDMAKAVDDQTPKNGGRSTPLPMGPTKSNGKQGSPVLPSGPPGTWPTPADPRQCMQHGGFKTPEQQTAQLLGTPTRMSPMSTPVAAAVPPPSPYNSAYVQSPNQPMMAMVAVPQQANGMRGVAMPVGAPMGPGAMAAMTSGAMAPRAPGPQNSQQPSTAPSAGTPQVVAMPTPARPGTPGIQSAPVAAWQPVPWCPVPWPIEMNQMMQGGQAAFPMQRQGNGSMQCPSPPLWQPWEAMQQQMMSQQMMQVPAPSADAQQQQPQLPQQGRGQPQSQPQQAQPHAPQPQMQQHMIAMPTPEQAQIVQHQMLSLPQPLDRPQTPPTQQDLQQQALSQQQVPTRPQTPATPVGVDMMSTEVYQRMQMQMAQCSQQVLYQAMPTTYEE